MNLDIDLPDGWEANQSFSDEEGFVSLRTTDAGGHIDVFQSPDGVTLHLRTVDSTLSTWEVESREGVAEQNIQEELDELVSLYHEEYEDETYTGE